MSQTRTRTAVLTLVALASVALGASSCSQGSESSGTASASPDTVATAEHGAYLATVMGCHDCHTPGGIYGTPDFQRALSGSEVGWGGPWGVSYPRNLTPDPATGIGAWTEDDIVHTIQTGIRPNGSHLLPPMPWPDFAHLTPRDARSLAKYLKSIVPVQHKVPDAVPPGKKANGPVIVVPPPSAWDTVKQPVAS